MPFVLIDPKGKAKEVGEMTVTALKSLLNAGWRVGAPTKQRDEIARLRDKCDALDGLVRDLLAVWDPQWEPGKSLRQRALGIINESN